jgi:predicted ATPase
VTIPATLRDSLMARLDRYAPVKEIAQMGAAIGRQFSYELIAAVAPLQHTQLDEALTSLTDSGLAFRSGAPPGAVYTFKHALVQDAAYDSLLKSKRQALHAKIAKVIEEHFPQTRDTEPEVLAHHYTEASIAQQASVYWLSAGRASYGRSALTEAMRQLGFGIDQIEMLPAGETRDRIELDTQLCLGNTLIQAKGLASPEADVAFKRALKLSGLRSRPNELAPIMWGIFVVKLIAGQPRAAVEIAKQLLSKTQGEREAELVARTAMMDAHFWMGDFEVAEGYYEEALDLYDEGLDVSLIASYAFDMKSTNLLYASHFQWMLGYPDRARRTKELLDAWANHLDNPFMSAFAYTWGAGVFHYCRELDKHRLQVERGRELSLQIGFPHFEGQAQFWCAWNRAKTGDLTDENIERFQSAIVQYAEIGSGLVVPYFRALRAEALSERGEIPAALSLVKEAVELVDTSGEASHAAEIHRIHADILLRGDPVNSSLAEQMYRSSLDIARRQKARSWELRTSTSLARLWQEQGKKTEALELLTPVYDWFTEGFDTKDLKDAKALLDELSA